METRREADYSRQMGADLVTAEFFLLLSVVIKVSEICPTCFIADGFSPSMHNY